MQLSEEAITRIKGIMKSRGIRHIDISKETNIDKSDLSSYLSGKRPISKKTLQKIASCLDVDAGWILFGDEALFRYREQVRTQMLNEIESAINERRLSDDQLKLMISITELSDDQIKSITNSFQNISKLAASFHSTDDIPYQLAEQNEENKKRKNKQKDDDETEQSV